MLIYFVQSSQIARLITKRFGKGILQSDINIDDRLYIAGKSLQKQTKIAETACVDECVDEQTLAAVDPIGSMAAIPIVYAWLSNASCSGL